MESSSQVGGYCIWRRREMRKKIKKRVSLGRFRFRSVATPSVRERDENAIDRFARMRRNLDFFKWKNGKIHLETGN